MSRNSRNRDEKAAGGLPPHSFIFDLAFYYSSFTCPRIPSHPLLVRVGPVGLASFCSRRGSLGKADAHQEEKGLPTHYYSRLGRGIPFAPENLPVLPFPDMARFILPAREIMHAELNP